MQFFDLKEYLTVIGHHYIFIDFKCLKGKTFFISEVIYFIAVISKLIAY